MTFDKVHIAAFVVAIGLALFGVYSYEAHKADLAEQRATAQDATAKLLVQQNQQFQQQMQQEFQQLAQALSARQVIEVKIPQANQALTSSQTADAITKATNAKPGEVTAVNDTVVMDLPVSRTVLDSVQLVPLLQQDKVDLGKQLDLEKQSHASDVKADAAQLQACKLDVVAQKKKTRKAVIKAFFLGLVVGIVGGHAAGI
jgi:RNA-binding protein YhbY